MKNGSTDLSICSAVFLLEKYLKDNWGLNWNSSNYLQRNEKTKEKRSQIIKLTVCLLFYLLFILWRYQSKGRPRRL
jgi:uncharacterized membrane protein